MRKMNCYQVCGQVVQDVLDEFNERAEEFGIGEKDIISISAMPPTRKVKIATERGTKDPLVEVVIFYWVNY